MTSHHGRAVAWVALTLLVADLMAPNITWAWFGLHERGIPIGSIGLAACLTFLWFALFGKRLWLGCLLLSPLALLMPLALYYIIRYHDPARVDVLGTIYATTAAETRQYLSGAMAPLIIASGISLGLALFAAWAARRSRLRWSGRRRVASACIVAAAVLALPIVFGHPKRAASGLGARISEYSHMYGPLLARWTSRGYPFGVPVLATEFSHYALSMDTEAKALAAYRFDARLATPMPKRQIYVVVIGESSQRGHWQLFGYQRPTNPELSKEPNLIPITHMVSAYTQTMLALPVMLTRQPATWPKGRLWPQASIVRAMHEAGFATWWISNQYAIGPYDSPVAIYANEADHLEWLNHGDSNSSAGQTDSDLIAPLRHAISSSTGNVFVVLHTLGSHGYYDYRYPPQFARFKPTQSHCPSLVPQWQCILNSYDNTVVYTDHVLAEIITVLKHSGAVSALWYASDHGETLPSPTCHETGHAYEDRPEYQIPALFWYSNAYDAAFPKRVATIRANANKKTMSENEFPSIIDMAGVTFPGHAKRESWSLVSPEWHFHTRWVNQFWRANFDTAKVANACGGLLR